jgi:hypothetical protein
VLVDTRIIVFLNIIAVYTQQMENIKNKEEEGE